MRAFVAFLLIPLVAGVSTTDLVTEILRRYRD